MLKMWMENTMFGTDPSTGMTREDFINRKATYSRAASRWGRSCVVLSLVAMVVMLRNPLPSLQVATTFIIAVATPIIVVLVVLGRLAGKLGLGCIHCGRMLVKGKRAEAVLNTGKCPLCQGRIIEDKAQA